MFRALMFVTGLALFAAEAPPLPRVTAEPLEDGSVIRVKNVGAQPMAAFLVELVGYPGSRFTLAKDESNSPLAAGEERRYPVRQMMPGAAPEYVRATAAIYADGSSAGEAEKVKLLKAAMR
jgi:hypothetical protein